MMLQSIYLKTFILDDLDEFLDAKRIRSKKEKSYYLGKLYLAAYSAQIKRRKSKGIGKLKKEMLYGSAPSAEERRRANY